MATSSTIESSCATRDCKSSGVLKCEGCSQRFCRKHESEHHHMLTHQLGEIVLEYDMLQQILNTQNDQDEDKFHSILNEIDRWEKESVEKIKRTAQETREQMKLLLDSKKEIVSKKLHDLAEQLEKARMDDNYVETNLRIWLTTVENLKNDMNILSSIITIQEDPTKNLVNGLIISTVKPEKKIDEIFGEFYGPIRLENDKYLARHCGEKRIDAFLRGQGEYSSDKHQIRFIINRQITSSDILFGIVSKQMNLSQTNVESDQYSIFGWWSNDETYPRSMNFNENRNLRDLTGQKTLEIELLLDCDNKIISYFNERTQIERKLNIDIKKCPFPWQLVFNLYDIGDQVRLIRSCEKHFLE